jgi:hypothetical protein
VVWLRGFQWLWWCVDALIVCAALVVCPVAAIIAFAVGDAATGWKMLVGVSGAAIYGVALVWEATARRGRHSPR